MRTVSPSWAPAREGVTRGRSTSLSPAGAATRDGVKIKFHDKKGALVELLRLFNEMDRGQADGDEPIDDDPLILPNPGFTAGLADAIRRAGGREN